MPNGETKVTATFTIPEAAYGNNFVQFLRGWRPDTPYGFSFSVVPNLTVSPSPSSPHSSVTVKGTGFPAKNKDIKVLLDGNDTAMSIYTSDVGTFSGQLTIPETMAGSHTLKAYDENLSFGDITANLQIAPKISIEPQHPEIGSEVTLTGWGFASRSTVSVKYDDVAVSNSPITTDNGNFTETFTVPESSSETHIITATDRAGNVATSGMAAENKPPEAPNPISPVNQRFGWFGAQPVIFTWGEVSDPSGIS